MLLRKAVGRLAASPLFTAFAVLSLAGGLAVTTAVYSVVDTLLLAQIEARDPESLAVVMTPRDGAFRRAPVSVEDLDAIRRAQTSFERLSGSFAELAQIESTRHAEVMPVEAVDGEYFPVAGIAPAAGRLIDTSDERTGARVAVISAAFWRSRFAADPAVTTRSVTINGESFSIVGVASDRFAGLEATGFGTRIWVPLSSAALLSSDLLVRRQPDRASLTVVGRLRSSRALDAASAEIALMAGQLDSSRPLPLLAAGAPPRLRHWSMQSVLTPSEATEGMRRMGVILVVLVGLVLVVACTNLANLVVARGTARQGELAVRMAMGASRGRLVWEQSIESLVVSVLGAAAAYAVFIALSAWMTQDFTFVLPPMGHFTLSIRPEINRDALAVSFGALLLSLAVFGLEPAVQLARSLDIRTALAVAASGVRPRTGRQRTILRWQVAVATGFFIVATTFIRVTVEQARHQPGIDMDRVALATLNFKAAAIDAARLRRAVDQVLMAAAADTSIAAASASTGMPFGIRPALRATLVRPGPDGGAESIVAGIAATPAIFRVLGIPIVSGRAFNDTDVAAAARVVVLSETAGKQVFPGTDPVGQPIAMIIGRERVTATIIGISRNTDVGSLKGPQRPLVFVPLAQHFESNIVIAARAAGRVSSAVAVLRREVQAADPDLRVELSGSARVLLSGHLEVMRSAGRGALYLGAFTLLLSMAGLFGVQSHLVTYRTREFGVRISLGASARHIKTMVIRDGARPVFDGLVLGLWGGVAGRLLIRWYLEVDVAVFDPWMVALAPLPIVSAALAACYWPAARAARVDAKIALRCE